MRLLMLLGVQIACVSAAAAGVSIDYEQLRKGYETQIRSVQVCGAWRHGASSGFFRVTEAYIFAQSFFYAQWMRDYDQATNALATSAATTLSFPDVFTDHAEIELSDIRCVQQADGVRVTAAAYFFHDEKTKRMVLDLFAEPGKYKLEFL